MAPLFSFVLIVIAILLAIPVVVFFIEILAAVLAPTRKAAIPSNAARQRVAVLVPAHNESDGILPTLADIKKQLSADDRLLIVADNCSDDTAAVATAAGAETIERHDPTKIGKGYALDFGLRHLSLDPPSIVMVIDADCRVAEGAIDRLAATCAATGRPVQALDLMTTPNDSPINHRAAEFAWRVKNWVRPLGLNALSLPCQLMGTGMAFPWKTIGLVKVASGSVVEDIRLGLDMAQTGNPPIFCPFAMVTSEFPISVEGATKQRRRWEEGHLSVILTTVPRLIGQAVARGNLSLLTLAVDLAVPPVSFLFTLLVGMSLVAGIAVFFGLSPIPLAVSAASLAVLLLAICLAWLKYGRDILPASKMPAIALYICAKLPIYRRFLFGGVAAQWTRAERKKVQASDDTG
jgi:cellulose synthase/poly-beta-1,6-N-acetylglucosamine synthase-like glycosyltransferase